MAINDFNIGFLGKLDGTRSRNQINQDIDALKKSLNSLEIKATLDPKQTQALSKQLNLLQVSLSDASFSPKALNDLVSQVNNALKGIQINIPNINTSTAGKSATQAGQQIGQQIQNGINSAIQKGDFSKLKEYNIFGGNQNTIAQKAKKDFGDLTGSIVTVKEEMKNIDGNSMLNAFTVNLKNAKGEVESLRYSLQALVDDNGNKTGDIFRYTSGSVNDAGAVKQFQQMEKAATDYQNKLDTLKTKYANLNVDYSGFEDTLVKFKNGTADANELSTAFNTLNNSITGSLNSLKSQTSSFDQIQQTMNNMRDLPSMIQNLETSMSGLSDKSSVAGISIKDLQTTYSTLLAEMTANGGKVPTSDTWIKSYKDLTSTVAGAKTQVDALVKSEAKTGKSNITKELTELQRLTKANTVEKWYANNTAVAKLYGKELDEIVAKYRELGTAMTKADSDKLQAQFKTIEASAREANKIGFSFTDKLKNAWQKFGGWSLATGAMVKGFQAAKNMVNDVVELDTAMTSLYKVTDETDASYNKFFDNATEKAKQLGATITDVINSSADFAKLGYSLDDASKLAEIATIYKNVGDIDIGSATESIVSTMKAFGYSADEAMAIIDKFNQVGNNFAISSADIGEALQRSASSLVVGGNTLDESIALITAGNTITQDADTVGTALKTVSLRINSTTAELEEMGESTEYACETMSDYRDLVMGLTHNKVDILGSDGNYKSTYEILQGISKVWKDMNSMEQSSLLKSLFGTRQANIGASIIEQFDTAEQVLASSLDSTGSAVAENEKYLESIEGKTKQFEASVEELASTIIDSSLIKWFVDFGTTAIGVLDNIMSGFNNISKFFSGGMFGLDSNSTGGSLGAISGLIMSLTGNGAVQYNSDNNTFVTWFSKLKNIVPTVSKEVSDFFQMADVQGLNLQKLSSVNDKVFDKFCKKYKVANTDLKQFLRTWDGAGDISESYQQWMVANGKATTGFSSALKSVGNVAKSALATLGSMVAMWAIGEVISLSINAIDKYVNKEKYALEAQKESISSLKQATDELKQNQKSLEDSTNKYTEYYKVLKDSTSTIDEITSAKESLADIQDQLSDKFGIEAEGIDLVNGKYDEQIAKLKEIEKYNNSNYLTDNKDNYEKAKKYLDTTTNYGEGLIHRTSFDTGLSEIDNLNNANKELQSKYKDIISLITSLGAKKYETDSYNSQPGLYSVDYYFKELTKEKAYNIETKLVDELDRNSSKYTKDEIKIINTIISEIKKNVDSNAIADSKTAVLDYQKNSLDKPENGKYKSLYDSLQNSINNYNNIVQTGNSETIGQSKKDIEKLWNEFKDNGKDASNTVKDAFDNLYSGYNPNKILEDFNTAKEKLMSNPNFLFNNGSSGNQLTGDAQEWLQGLNDTDLQIVANLSVTDDNSLDDVKIRFENAKKAAEDATEATETFSEKLKGLSDVTNGIGSLTTAYSQINENGFANLDTINGLSDTFGDLSSYENFVRIVGSSTSSFEEMQQAFNDLTTEYINKSEILDKLNESNKDLYITQLKQQGITNAEAIVTEQLNSKLEAQRIVTEQLSMTQEQFNSLSYDNQVALLDEANASDTCRAYILELQLAEITYNKNGLDVSGKIESLKNLAIAYGIANDAATQMVDRQNAMDAYEKRTGAITGFQYTEADYKHAEDDLRNQIAAKFNGLGNVKTAYNGGADYQKSLEKSAKDASSSAKESSSKVFDFIETRLSRLERRIKLFANKITDYTSSAIKKGLIESSISSIGEKINAEMESFGVYANKANSISLDEYWKSQVRDGSLNIADIQDDDLSQAISDYQSWYEKALSCEEEIDSLKTSQLDKVKELSELQAKMFQNEMDYIDYAKEYKESMMSINDTNGKWNNAEDYQAIINLDNQKLDLLAKQNSEYAKYQFTLDNTSDAWQDVQEKIQNNVKSYNDILNDIAQKVKEIEELPIKKLQVWLDYYDSVTSEYKSKSELKSTKSDLSISDYRSQMNVNSESIAAQTKQMESYYWEYLRAGALGNQQAQLEYAQKYHEAQNAITQLKLANEELKKSLRDDVYWRNFERAHTSAQSLANILKGLSSLIDENSLFNKDTGGFTDSGRNKIALTVKQYETAKKEVSNYMKDIKNLETLYRRGFYSSNEYNEKLKELQQSLIDSTNDVKSYSDALVELTINQGQKEIDILKETIEARKDALNKKKEYYDYDKTIRSKTKDIQSLETQKAALLATEDTLEKRKKLLEIEEELQSKRDDLTDTQTEHEINLVVNGLDDFVNDVQTTYDDYSDKLKSSLEMQTEIINDANKMYAESYNSIKKQINNLLKSYGVDVSLSSNANFSGLVGFASGGSVAGQIRKNGDSLLASVNPGETILTQDFTKMLPDLVGTMKDFVNIDVPNYSNFTSAKTPIVNINYDGNLVNVEGSATTSTIDELRKLTPQIAKEVTKTITQDIKKNGFK